MGGWCDKACNKDCWRVLWDVSPLCETGRGPQWLHLLPGAHLQKRHCIRVPKWPKSIFRFPSFLLMTPLCATEKSCIAVLPRRWMYNKAVQRICVLTKSFSFEVCEVWSGVCKGWVCQSVKLEVGGGGVGGSPLTALLSSITPFRGRTFMLTTLPRLMDSRNGNLRYLERKSDGAVCFGGTNLERSQLNKKYL